MAQITIGRRLTQATDSVTTAQGDAGSQAWPVGEVNKIVPKQFDRIDLTYVGTTDFVRTASYYQGATLVATLTISYDGSNRITSVSRA